MFINSNWTRELKLIITKIVKTNNENSTTSCSRALTVLDDIGYLITCFIEFTVTTANKHKPHSIFPSALRFVNCNGTPPACCSQSI